MARFEYEQPLTSPSCPLSANLRVIGIGLFFRVGIKGNPGDHTTVPQERQPGKGISSFLEEIVG